MKRKLSIVQRFTIETVGEKIRWQSLDDGSARKRVESGDDRVLHVTKRLLQIEQKITSTLPFRIQVFQQEACNDSLGF